MGISTNAGFDDKLSPAARRAAEDETSNQGVMQDAEERAKQSAARREVLRAPILQLEAQQKLGVKDENGQVVEFDGIALDYQLDEPEYDESVPTLAPYVLRWEESPFWPPSFGPQGSRYPLRPVLGPKAWELILDTGAYCMRCLARHAAANPAECAGCGLTAVHRSNAIEYLERAMQVRETFGMNREQRRAMKRAPKRPELHVARTMPSAIGG